MTTIQSGPVRLLPPSGRGVIHLGVQPGFTYCGRSFDAVAADDDHRRVCLDCAAERTKRGDTQTQVNRQEAIYPELWDLLAEIEAMLDLRVERVRALRIQAGLPADPPMRSVEEIRAETADLRAANDAVEVERMWRS